MHRLIISIWLALFAVPWITAQEQLDFNTINNETYRLVLAQQWDSVVSMGYVALDRDIDYFYLRLRLGIAFYHQKNYRKAAGHFSRALKFSPGDPLALEYLYYSRLFAGQHEQADLLRKQFKGELATRLSPNKGKFADRIGGNYLYCAGKTGDYLEDSDLLSSERPEGVRYVTKYFSNASFSLSQSIIPGISLHHAFNYLSKYNHLYYDDLWNQLQLSHQHVRQYQYYISPSVTVGPGLTIRPMFHLVSVHFQSPVYTGQGNNPQLEIQYLDSMDYATGFGFGMGLGPMDVNLGFYYANLNNGKQLQNRAGFTWYPMGNLNLYAGVYLNTQYEMKDRGDTLRFIPEMHAGIAIAGKVWIDLSATLGNMTHYLEHNGTVVYNSFGDVIRRKVTGTISIPVTKKGSLVYLGGRWTAHRSEFYPFNPDQNLSEYNVDYNSLSIYGGISWKI